MQGPNDLFEANSSVSSFKDGVEVAEDARINVNRDRAPHGSYELVIHKVSIFIIL